MATLLKDVRGRSPFYYCQYRAADGRWLKKSTKQTDRSKAMEIALRLEQAENAAKVGTFTEQTARKLLGEILERVTGDTMQNYKIRQWFEHWLDLKEKVRSQKTMTRYRQVIRDYLKSLGARAELGLTHLSSKDVLNYRDSLRASRRTERTANLSVKVISAALNTACRQQHIASNPALAVEHLKVREVEKGVFTHEQVGKLLANAKGDWRRAIRFAYYTGARLSDVAKMQWESIDLEEKLISFTPSKTGKPLRIPLHSDLERELLKQPGIGKAYVFPSLAAVKSTGGRHGLSGQFRAIMDKAGINGVIRQRDDGSRAVSSLGFHSLRHTFASVLANHGVNEETRMKLTGHSTREVHALYTHHEAELLRAAIEIIPAVQPGDGPLLPLIPRKISRSRHKGSAALRAVSS
jgi:integrase